MSQLYPASRTASCLRGTLQAANPAGARFRTGILCWIIGCRGEAEHDRVACRHAGTAASQRRTRPIAPDGIRHYPEEEEPL
jgi:hypothetical protein